MRFMDVQSCQSLAISMLSTNPSRLVLEGAVGQLSWWY